MKQIPNDLFFAWVESEIAEGRSVKFRLKGNSMFPLLRNGKDEVILEKCFPENLKPMDVILFRYRGAHVLHRIIKRKGNDLLIQGDGSIVAMEHCTVNDVVGKVTSICRSSGKTILIDSWKWKLYSHLWRRMGCSRKWILKVAYKLFLKQE